MQLFRKQHGSRIRRPPQNRLALIVPRENAVPVCFEETLRAEIPSYGKEAFGRSLINRWETKIVPV